MSSRTAPQTRRDDATIDRILGTNASDTDLGALLSDLEGMSDDTARMIYGSLAIKTRIQKRVFARYIDARTR